MDIAKPGKTRAESTAKPVIVGHKPMVQDPMMVKAKPTPEAPSQTPPPPPPSSAKKVITPLSDSNNNTTPEEKKPEGLIPNLPDLEHALAKDRKNNEETKEEPTGAVDEVDEADSEASDGPLEANEPVDDDKKDSSEEEEAIDATPADERPLEPEGNETAVVDTLLGQMSDKQKQAKDAALAEERDQHINKLVAEKKYFIPIAKAKRRRRQKIVLITLILIFLLGGLAAADAGFIPGIEPPFGLLSSEATEPAKQANTTDAATVAAEKSGGQEVDAAKDTPLLVEPEETVYTLTSTNDLDSLGEGSVPVAFQDYLQSEFEQAASQNSSLVILVDKIQVSDQYVAGVYKVGAEDQQVIFYEKDGVWDYVSADPEITTCDEVKAYAIPMNFLKQCLDTATNKAADNNIPAVELYNEA